MRFGKILVELQRLRGCPLRLWHHLQRRYMLSRQAGIAVRKAGISDCVIRLDGDRLLEILDALVQPLLGHLVLKVFCLEIRLDRFRFQRSLFRLKRWLDFRLDPGFQFTGNRPRNLILQQ